MTDKIISPEDIERKPRSIDYLQDFVDDLPTPESYLAQLGSLNGDLLATVFDDAATLATWPRADQARLFVELHRLGVAETLLAELRTLINSHKKRTPKPKPDTATLKQSERIAADLAAWGYGDIWLNELDNTVMLGNRRLDDVQLSVMRTIARDHNYAELKLLGALDDAIVAIADGNRRNPIREYLSSLTWDGTDHIQHIADHFVDQHDFFTYADGTQRTAFHAFLLRWMIGSVARIYGDSNACRDSFVLTIAGKQGSGKSHFASYICPLSEFLTERHIDVTDKDISMLRAKTWIWEVAELGSVTKRADVEHLKQFVTAAVVEERKPYGHFPAKLASITSFLGTINLDGAGFLLDRTGNRRFVVIELQKILWDYTKIDVAGAWAQAVSMWRENPSAYRLSPEETEFRDANNERHTDGDIYADIAARVFEIDPTHDDWRMSTSEMLEKMRMYGGLSSGQDAVAGRELSRSLKKHWGLESKRSNGKTMYTGIRVDGRWNA